VLAVGQVVVWLMPSRRIRDSGVDWRTMMTATGVAVAGFFLVPVLGAVLGFVGTLYVRDRVRLGSRRAAWAATRRTMRAVGGSVLVELLACLLVAGAWLGAVIAG
jgi:hypothetical protein